MQKYVSIGDLIEAGNLVGAGDLIEAKDLTGAGDLIVVNILYAIKGHLKKKLNILEKI